MQSCGSAGADGNDEEFLVAQCFCQGIVVIVVNFGDGKVVVGGKGGVAREAGQDCDLMLQGTKEVGEDMGADLSGALSILLVRNMM
jgi:hypothetical protein